MVNLDYPYVQYTEKVARDPDDSELVDEGYAAWAIATRLGKTINFFGTELGPDMAPRDEDFFEILAAHSRIPLGEIKREAIGGKVFEGLPDVIVQSAGEDAERLAVLPEDVAEELRAFARTTPQSRKVRKDADFPLRLIARRVREVSNTSCRDFPTARKRMPFNPLFLHPEDLRETGLDEEAECWLVSDNGRVPAIIRTDSTLKPGTVSMVHGFGGLADEEVDYRERGASVSLLVSLDRDCEPLQSMPRMSGVPVRVEAR
jgi:anaerobic selenocysteine-containing dehydrogenase